MKSEKYGVNLGGAAISDIVCDSRQAGEGTAFVCLTGARLDGHDYARAAYERGCRLFICERKINLPSDAVILTVPDSREAFAALSAELYGYPARSLTMIGVTGTKGKSTVATMLSETLNSCGHKCALIGTTGIFIGGERRATENTTPECNILHKTFAEALEKGCTHLVMEVSSQAYKMKRVYGVSFDLGVFTNLSPDHISAVEHADYAEYRECKAMLFRNSAASVLNADDDESDYMRNASAGECVYYGIMGDKSRENSRGMPLTLAGDITPTGDMGSDFVIKGVKCHVGLPGIVNVSNAAAVLACCERLGIPLESAAAGLADAAPVKGRFEKVRVAGMEDRSFIIDYAHNGVSLEFALETLRSYNPGRLICLFGSIGGRAELRRRELGETAARLADFSVITSDNPDFEEPEKIISEIEGYMDGCPHICITDRAEAIKWTVENSRAGDVVLFAGKGHEDYQIIKGVHEPFDERGIILETASLIQA